jgi:hypothetical protein
MNEDARIDENAIVDFLDKKEVEYESICKQAGKEVWTFYSDSSQNTMGQYKLMFSNFFKKDSLFTKIREFNSVKDQLSNDTIVRRIELWNRLLICAVVDFDPQILELQNNLEHQLSRYPSVDFSDDELEVSILKLIELRNRKARELGYGNYAYLLLQNTGIDTIWFERLIETIDSATAKPYEVFIRKNITSQLEDLTYAELRPYIIQSYMLRDDPFVENELKGKLINETLSVLGIDLNNLPIQFEIKQLPPGIGGFGNCLEIPKDFRAVAMEDLSFYYLLHEIGHGLHWTNVKVKQPVLKGYEWFTGNLNDAWCESMAETIAKFSMSKNWMMKNGFDECYADSIQQHTRYLYPLYLRLNLINTLFEIEIYKNPQKAPALIKRQLYAQYFFVEKDFSKLPNLIRLPYVSYPVYEQNYLIADIVSWQIHDYLKCKYGPRYFFNENVGNYLKSKLWKDGELLNWYERVKRATGREIDVKGYLKSVFFPSVN